MNKGDLMKLVLTKDELRNVDSAIPLDWANAMRDRGIQPFYYVWNYNENRIHGEPLNLCERFFTKYVKLPETIMGAELDKEKIGAMIATLSLVKEALCLDG